MTASERTRRQSAADRAGRAERIAAVTRDLLADVDYYTDMNEGDDL